jgi:hypothetical protein
MRPSSPRRTGDRDEHARAARRYRTPAAHPELRCLIAGGVHRLGEQYAAALRARVDRVFDIRHHVRAVEQVFADALGDAPVAVAG